MLIMLITGNAYGANDVSKNKHNEKENAILVVPIDHNPLRDTSFRFTSRCVYNNNNTVKAR